MAEESQLITTGYAPLIDRNFVLILIGLKAD